jgi:histidinol-phosphate aminotransferase
MYRFWQTLAVDRKYCFQGFQRKQAMDAVDDNTKMIFVLWNNPTGNSFSDESVVALLQNFKGFVVIDEAYIDFQETKLAEWTWWIPNLIITQTLSKPMV